MSSGICETAAIRESKPGTNDTIRNLRSQISDLRSEAQTSPGQRSSKFLPLQILPDQIRIRSKVPAHLVDQGASGIVTVVFDLLNIVAQLSAASFQVFNQQRIAFDTGHDPRHDEITKKAPQSGDDGRIKPEHQ